MTTQYTSLLGLALPVTGEINGTWGDVVNNSITQLVEDSVANKATASVTGGDWTLTTTGTGLPNQARCAILIPTGTPGVTRNIIAPSSSKAYIVINQSDAAVVVKGAATTGVSIPSGVRAIVAWNGSDFIKVGGSSGTYDIQTFTGSGTWTKPADVSQVRVIAIGGGGGGGSGRKGATATDRLGGGGGGGAARIDQTISASSLGSTVTVTIGLGGSGGAAQTTNTTDGNAGADGGNTTFGTYLTAYGGYGGTGGSALVSYSTLNITSIKGGFDAATLNNTAWASDMQIALSQAFQASRNTSTTGGFAWVGGSGSFSGSRSSGGSSGNYGPGSGGAGGLVTSANALSSVGYGGIGALLVGSGFAAGTASASDAAAGGNGTAATPNSPYGGGGGGGGQASLLTNAGAGGNGALYGAGGGGGGAAVNSVGNSGKGGDGASGICVVISW